VVSKALRKEVDAGKDKIINEGLEKRVNVYV